MKANKIEKFEFLLYHVKFHLLTSVFFIDFVYVMCYSFFKSA